MFRPTILVCDNDSLIRFNLKRHLRAAGYRVFSARNVDAAKTVLQEGLRINLLATNVTLSEGFDGILLSRWAEKHFPGTLTLNVPRWYKHDGCAECFDGLVLKPSAIAVLLNLITKILPILRPGGEPHDRFIPNYG